MKKFSVFFIWVLIFLGAFNFVTFYIYNLDVNDVKKIVSPLPDFLKNTFRKSVQASDFWSPSANEKKKFANTPLISAKAAISYDLTTDTYLYGENINHPMPIASLTKIMTAVIVLENMNLSDTIKISEKAATIGENSMGLSAGEVHTVEELLYGLLLPSGNDAATALSEGSPFGSEGFLHNMNRKAEELGLTTTRFTNPSGLEGDGHQYSTPKELLILTRYALQNPDFAKIVSTFEYHIPSTQNHKEYWLYNETNLLTTYPGVKGVKTGYTEEAGMCLVSYLEHDGHKIIAVILNSQNRREEMRELLNYSLRELGKTPPAQ